MGRRANGLKDSYRPIERYRLTEKYGLIDSCRPIERYTLNGAINCVDRTGRKPSYFLLMTDFYYLDFDMKKYPYQHTDLENIKGEQWKDIPGLELYFQVSNYGRIKRLEYELTYSDGRVYIKPAKIIKPVLAEIPNHFIKDAVYFLRTTVTLFKVKYNFSLARLVYHCFIKPIKPDDESVVILMKDRDTLNIKPSNLILATLSEKQQRIHDLHRTKPLFVDPASRKKGIEKSKLANNKQVTQYSMKGKKIKTYPSIAAASQKTGISPSHISNRANGTEFSAGGFIWRLGNSSTVDIQPMLDTIAEGREKKKANFGKKVTQYKLNGARVAIYPSINDAEKATGIRHTEISRVMQKRRSSAGGYFWQQGTGPARIDLSQHAYGEALRAKNRQKPIRQYSKEGRFLQQFDSIKDAAKSIGVNPTTVTGALRGKHETAGGYTWKYV